MFVCVCNAVLERALGEGADSLDALTAKTGAGACCGSCRPLLLNLIDEHRYTPALAA
jgi:bacterioferritin-associated ferredoxin